MELKRYVYEVELTDLADSDEEAKARAANLARLIQSFGDNKAKITSITEVPFGTMEGRNIEL